MVFALLKSFGDSLGLARATSAGARRLAVCRAEELADLEEVGFERVHETGRLAVFGGGADGEGVVFDDVADAKAVGGGGAEAEVA